MGSGSSPSSSGNLGGSGRRVVISQVAVHYMGQMESGLSKTRFKRTNSSLLDQLDDSAGTYSQPNAALCHAVNWAGHAVEGMIKQVSLYSEHFSVAGT
jgi:hypothetical protein